MTGNLKICLRVVEPPEETLLLAPPLPTFLSLSLSLPLAPLLSPRDGDRVDDEAGGSTNYTTNEDIAFINSFAATNRRRTRKF